ncbi:DUF6268 family outer membrane beta-barrel protein [Reichenbachiella sp.]|uniref:DUF6268 family outer membrane beta-barrel protein n=1 Tax=Reichenbachiella sp. TaxID=2184521 RepID=UPI0032987906
MVRQLKNIGTLLLAFSFYMGKAQQETDSIYPRLEKFPVFSMDYFDYPNSDFEIDSGEGQLKMNEFRAAVQIVSSLKKDKTYLFNKLQYSLLSYEADFDINTLNSEKDFHAIEYTLGLIQVLPQRWRLIATATPMLSSDFEESISSDDFLLQATGLAIKRSNEYLEYGFGFTYTTKFGNPLLLPVLKLTYKKNKWSTLISLPSYASQFYDINEKTKIGLKIAVFGNAFNASFREGLYSSDVNRVVYSRITLGPEIQVRLIKDLYFNASSGIRLRNILEVQDSDLSTIGDFDIDNQLFFNVGLKILK